MSEQEQEDLLAWLRAFVAASEAVDKETQDL